MNKYSKSQAQVKEGWERWLQPQRRPVFVDKASKLHNA